MPPSYVACGLNEMVLTRVRVPPGPLGAEIRPDTYGRAAVITKFLPMPTGSAAAGTTVESAAGSAKTPRSPQLPLLSRPGGGAPRSAQEPADGARDGVRDSKAAGLNPGAAETSRGPRWGPKTTLCGSRVAETASAAAASVHAGGTLLSFAFAFLGERFRTAQPPQAGHVSQRFGMSLAHCGQAFIAPRFFPTSGAVKSGGGAPHNDAHLVESVSTSLIDCFATAEMSRCLLRCRRPHPTHMKGVPF